ncbi:hypothetical protein [Membranihabitans maritimus]|uniref:hypothetical protein n=1 Tax=Membranihabitans maritimus TaxID=2904244 RepID=UPI001F173D24|nr:hypothetical protein [Membranihabitans maritimus]
MRDLKWLLFVCLAVGLNTVSAQSFVDEEYLQPISIKYPLKGSNEEMELQKILIDRDDNVYALSEEAMYVILDGQLVKDDRYLPLQGMVPKDLTIQSETGNLYYLFDDHYLSNAHAGVPYGDFDSGKFEQIAVSSSGKVLVTGGHEFQLFSEEFATSGREPDAILEVKAHGDDFFIRTEFGISKYEDGRFTPVVSKGGILSWEFGENQLFVSTHEGIFSVSTDNWKETMGAVSRLPVLEVTCMDFSNGKLWAGTEIGAFSTSDFEKFNYFQSGRWLLQDGVIDIAIDSKGNTYALTEGGISEIKYKSMTLGKKAEYFHDKVRKRHLRLGLIGETRLRKRGDLTTAELIDTDNDGLWTCFYLGSEVFKYATTGDPQAKKNALESFESFERLISINQLDGFPSRTFARKGFKVSDHERWRDSPQDGWEWKGHTSSDEFVAYLWVAGILHRHLDLTKEEEERVTIFIDDIMTHIIENDYYFVDVDGEPTLWGRWNPEYLNMYPETVVDRKLGSITLTAGLQLAYELTGKEIYKEEAFRLFEDHGYLDNIKIPYDKIDYTPDVIYQGHNMGMGGWNHSDDEMSFLTYWVLYHYAFNEDLKSIYSDVIDDHFEIEKPERNSLWSLITYGTTGKIDLPSVKWHLREFQMDMIRWNSKNSHRKDLDFLEPNFREQSIKEVLSPAERKTMRYNGNPFDLDGGSNGKRELAGDEYLLPYWMGRYLDVIIPEKN